MYHVDHDAKRVRRVSGPAAPTPYQGNDGEWRQFEAVVTTANGSLGFVWAVTPDGSGHAHFRTTITSPVIAEMEIVADSEAK